MAQRRRSDDPVRHAVITADDFGQAMKNNLGIIAAHRARVVNTTSLMMGESGVGEALEFVHQNPGLAAGLYVFLSDGTPVLPPSEVPLPVDGHGRCPTNERLLYAATRSAAGRAQIDREIAAQFEAFVATGLKCDHADVHRHSHMHPVVTNAVFPRGGGPAGLPCADPL